MIRRGADQHQNENRETHSADRREGEVLDFSVSLPTSPNAVGAFGTLSRKPLPKRKFRKSGVARLASRFSHADESRPSAAPCPGVASTALDVMPARRRSSEAPAITLPTSSRVRCAASVRSAHDAASRTAVIGPLDRSAGGTERPSASVSHASVVPGSATAAWIDSHVPRVACGTRLAARRARIRPTGSSDDRASAPVQRLKAFPQYARMLSKCRPPLDIW